MWVEHIAETIAAVEQREKERHWARGAADHPGADR